ncbi:hypothetical protein LOKG_00039 [Loktanella phage pCB2051-A]|uniref:Uncharacterized protein n=1 Tax=Loktanella phage pCB2051-A TaxID=754044 RepID=M4QPB4_9CAUD|nr:hypothetical protein LOKG_00039 [Loktanella phage pCB2051-A]AGH31475.1 hypothetical protein LOKG_00039 [Loktanella phage pCB2051-A]
MVNLGASKVFFLSHKMLIINFNRLSLQAARSSAPMTGWGMNWNNSWGGATVLPSK